MAYVKNLMSEAMWHKNCRRKVSNLTYPPGFNECDNDTDGGKTNSNNNGNGNNDNNKNVNTDDKNKNVNNDDIHFCNS